MKPSKCIRRDFARSNFGWLLLNALLLIISGAARTFGAGYIAPITAALQARQITALLVAIAVGGSLMASAYVLRWVTAGICTWLTEKLGVTVRLRLMEHLERLPFVDFEQSDPGKLQSLLRNDVVQAANIIYIEHSRILTNAFLFVIAVGYMIAVDTGTALTVTAAALLLGTVNQLILRKLKTYAKNTRAAVSKITGTVSSLCAGMNTVKTYRAQEFVRSFFDDGKRDYNNSDMRAEKVDAWRMTLYNIILNSAFYVSVLYLGLRGIRGEMELGEILVFLTLLRQIMTPIETIFRWMATLVYSKAAWERIDEQLQTEEERAQPLSSLDAPDQIDIRDITFAYSGKEPILKGLSLTLQKGTITALCGESGSGKTTLLKILLGLYDCPAAEFYADDASAVLGCLGKIAAFASADSQLFNMSIYQNIALGAPAVTRDRCRIGLERLGMKQWLDSLPLGLDTVVSEGAENLSGGQRQTIAVLRTILTDRPILILDEPFSALDREHEQKLLEWLDELKHDHLILLVTHRQSTVRTEDRTIMLKPCIRI